MTKWRKHIWVYKPLKIVALPPDNKCKHTMLVAWHKFDRYERHVLATELRIDLNKLPFVLAQQVWNGLIAKEKVFIYAKNDRPPYPFKNYRMRILRAVRAEIKREEKKRKRVRLRIEV